MPAPDFGDGSGTIDLGGPSTSDAEEFAADEACRYIFTDGGIEFGNLQLGAHTGTYGRPGPSLLAGNVTGSRASRSLALAVLG